MPEKLWFVRVVWTSDSHAVLEEQITTTQEAFCGASPSGAAPGLAVWLRADHDDQKCPACIEASKGYVGMMIVHDGDKVQVRQYRPGGHDSLLGTGVVKCTGARVIVLEDGTKWRAADGYAWGSKPERGLGRTFSRRIVSVP
jgi:hypothetical protein